MQTGERTVWREEENSAELMNQFHGARAHFAHFRRVNRTTNPSFT